VKGKSGTGERGEERGGGGAKGGEEGAVREPRVGHTMDVLCPFIP